MQCTTCGNDNLPQARFCARCGSVLAEVASPTPTPPLAQPAPSPVYPQGTVTVSAVTPVVAMLLAGLILGVMAEPVYYQYYGSVFAAVFLWIWAGGGVAATVWLSTLLRLEGRLPSAFGMLLIAVGSYIVFVSPSSSLIGTYVGHGVVGLGMGLTMPPTFWRLLPRKSVGIKVVLVIAAVAGLFLGQWTMYSYFGFSGVYAVTSAVALLVGLPAALASPTVRVPRHAGDTVSVADVPAGAPRRSSSKLLIVCAGIVIFAFAAALVVSQSIYNLPGYEWGIVQQFGQIRSVESTGGLHFKIPFVQQVTFLDKREMYTYYNEGEYLTSTQERVVVGHVTRWMIKDPLRFFVTLVTEDSGRDRLVRLVAGQLNLQISATPYNVMISAERDAIMNQVRGDVQAQVDNSLWGIEVIEVRIDSIYGPPRGQGAP